MVQKPVDHDAMAPAKSAAATGATKQVLPEGLALFFWFAGALSIATLVRDLFKVGVGPIVQSLLVFYNELIDVPASYLERLLLNLAAQLNIDVQVAPDWRHVFIIMFSMVAAIRRLESESGRIWSMRLTWFYGLLAAALASIGSGYFVARGQYVFGLAWPILMFVVFEVFRAVDDLFYREPNQRMLVFRRVLREYPVLTSMIGGLCIAGYFWLTYVQKIQFNAAAAFAVFMGCVCARNLAVGALGGPSPLTGWRAYMQRRPVRIAYWFLSLVLSAILTIAVGAGEELLR